MAAKKERERERGRERERKREREREAWDKILPPKDMSTVINFLQLGPTSESSHHLPIMPLNMNPSVSCSIDCVRGLMIQSPFSN
jgi:hypothetical protein